MKQFSLLLILFQLCQPVSSQTPDGRIRYQNQDLFLSGSNVPWVNFARDIGPSATNFTRFASIFAELKAAGGNSMRLWLHTTGHESPAFDASGLVTGPGTSALQDLKKICDLASEQKIGLQLCLWSFDMLRISNGDGITGRAKKLLTDTLYTNAYIRNALIPMVTELKGHPGILAWEVFNEPEGMSTEFGWEFNHHIPMKDIQRVVNLIAGAIHRADPAAQVTNGAWCFRAQTDVTFDGVPNLNYYRDDRLISAGGDPDGTLDFYNVHYYAGNFGQALSPFHHPKAAWGLDKPLVVAEFYLEDSHGKPWQSLYRNLLENGYAGAWSWAWDSATQNARTRVVMADLVRYDAGDVTIEPRSGVIFNFRTEPPVIDRGDSTLLLWDSSQGSELVLDGEPVPRKGKKILHPADAGEFTLSSAGEVSQVKKTSVGFYPSGKIWSFRATPATVAEGEPAVLSWSSSAGSAVTLNGTPVAEDGDLQVNPPETTTYYLSTAGETAETRSVTLTVLPADQVNRAAGKPVTVSGSEQGTGHDDPSQMVDENPSTWWTSYPAEISWVELDLTDTLAVHRIGIRWNTNWAVTYRLGVSTDRKAWTVVTWQKAGTGGVELLDSLTVTGRYVKLMLDKRAKTTSGYEISELQVFGVKKTGTGIREKGNLPGTPVLYPAWPNPFNPETTFRYELPAPAPVDIRLVNLLGQEIRILQKEVRPSGITTVPVSAAGLSSGVYLVRFSSGRTVRSQKLVLVK